MRHGDDLALSQSLREQPTDSDFGSSLLAFTRLSQEAFERKCPAPEKAKDTPDHRLTALAPHLWTTLGKKETEAVSQEDLRTAFKTKKLSAEDAGVLCALRQHFDSFVKPGSSAIKLADLKEFEGIAERVNEKHKTIGELEKNHAALFKLCDGNADQRLSEQELKAVDADPKTDATLKPLVAFLLANFKDLEDADPKHKPGNADGISLSGLQHYVSQWYNEGNGETALVRGVQGLIAEATNPALCRDLYADKTDAVKSIRPEAVKQGGLGDCYFLSALAALAQVKPSAIKEMIKDNGDETYTVTFPYTPDESVTVTKPTNQEILSYARGSEHGMWPAIMEKAYGAWIQKSIWRRNFFSTHKPDADPQEQTNGGSIIHHGLIVLTGGFPNHYFLVKKMDTDHMGTLLANGFKNERAITCVTGLVETDPALPAKHEYSVLAYDEESKMVTVRNPWGHFEFRNEWGRAKDGKNDGIFKMPLADFCAKFSGVAISRKTPPG